MAKRTRKKGPKQVETLTHDAARRKNIPSAEHASIAERFEELKPFEPVTYARANPLAQGETRDRDADLDPQIVWKGTEIRLTTAQIEALKAGEKVELGDAQLVWRGKDTQDWSDLVVQAPPIYVQEKIHPKHIIEDLKKQSKKHRDAETDAPDMFNLFGDFNGLDPEARTEFYRHDQNWQNRMILGDSLQVMASLAERESLRGKVQCIYFDPPYGIKFNSNWQVSTRSRDVKDGKLDQITREPEQVRAFRDTWKDGIHSYLTYLRDRLTAMRDLLTESGSIFVQIGDENVHRVRALMDEVFGEKNFVEKISYRTKNMTLGGRYLEGVCDTVIWYSRNIERLKYRRLYLDTNAQGDSHWNQIFHDGRYSKINSEFTNNHSLLPEGARLYQLSALYPTGSFDTGVYTYQFQGKEYDPPSGRSWKSPIHGMERLRFADRIEPYKSGETIRYRLFLDDYPISPIHNIWLDTAPASGKSYVVQTGLKPIQRCILMATDPGDLVLDPTCGSGTTAAVSEQWGRRWITIDTSRVALALARTRLMSARYPFYLLADSPEGRKKEEQLTGQRQPDIKPTGDIRQGFVYERAPHITLKSIANNAEIDVIWEKWQQILEPLRLELNAALGRGNSPQPSLIREETNEKSPPDKGDLGGSGKPTHIPYAPHLTDMARDLRGNPTPAEKKLWREVLSSNRLEGLKFLRQKPLGDYIVDFYCAEMMLAIELDGETHADRAAEDAERTETLAKFGVQVVRYTNAEVIDNLDGVYEDLQRRVLASRNPPRPSLIREGANEKSPPDKGDLGGLKPWQEWEIPRDPEADWSGDTREIHAKWWEARIKRQQEIDTTIAQKADVEYLYDRPYADPSRVRVAGPFTVESLSPHRVIPADESELIDELEALEGNRPRPQAPAQDFATMVLENLKSAGVHQSDKQDRIEFTAMEGWPGDYIAAAGTYEQDGIPKKAAIFIGPEFGSITRSDLMAAAREANEARFDVLIACGFNFDAHSSEVSKLGPLPILKAKMNPDLHMADDLKNTGAGNLFVVFGEPDIEWKFDEDGHIVVEVLGIDVFDPKTGEVRASGKDDIAAWFIDTDYNEESFFVRHAYFMGANDPYKQLKTSLKAEIDQEAWATLYRDRSRPFERPSTGRFAVKVINHFGDEVMKVFGV